MARVTLTRAFLLFCFFRQDSIKKQYNRYCKIKASTAYISTTAGRIHYRSWGQGAIPVIALHGYGDSSLSFQRYSLEEITLSAIDLPAHGQSDWLPSLTRSDLIDWINRFSANQTQPIILIGHSWGGRLLLSILEELPFQVHALILIAPDGLGTPGLDLWYRLGNRLQKWLSRQISFSKPLIGLSRFLHRIGIINRHGIRFIEHHLQTPERRKRLQLFARSSAEFRIYWKRLRAFQEKHRIPIHLFFGENDPLIDIEKGKKKADWLTEITIHLVEDAGHPLKDQRMANAVKKVLPDIYTSPETER